MLQENYINDLTHPVLHRRPFLSGDGPDGCLFVMGDTEMSRQTAAMVPSAWWMNGGYWAG